MQVEVLRAAHREEADLRQEVHGEPEPALREARVRAAELALAKADAEAEAKAAAAEAQAAAAAMMLSTMMTSV